MMYRLTIQPMLRLMVIVCLIFACSACSSRFVYKRADTLVNWYVDDYIDFDRPQQLVFDDFLEAQFDWHERVELPRYEAYMLQIEQQLQQQPNLSPNDVEAIYQQGLGFWEDFMRHALPGLQVSLAALNDNQVEAFIDALNDEQQELEHEFAEELRRPDKIIHARIKRTQKRLKPWLGKLSQEQIARVQLWANNAPDLYSQGLKERHRWQDRVAEAMVQRQDSQRFAAALESLLVKPEEAWQPSYYRQVQQSRQTVFMMLSDVYALADDAQKAKFLKRLQRYRSDVQKLQK